MNAPKEPTRPALSPGLQWFMDHERRLRVVDESRRDVHAPDHVVQRYLDAVNASGIPTPQRAAEHRWAAHRDAERRALRGLYDTVTAALMLNGAAEAEAQRLVSGDELDKFCEQLRARGWIVSVKTTLLRGRVLKVRPC